MGPLRRSLAGSALALVLARTSALSAQGDAPLSSQASALAFQRVVVDPSSPTDPWIKSIADLSGDGQPDLIVCGANGPLVWYQAPAWTKRVIAASAGSESGSAVGDVDGDGDADVVVGTRWYENAGNGSSWIARSLPDGGAGTHDISIADVSGDGKADIVMRGENQSLVWLFLQVNRTTWTEFTLEPGIGRNGLDVADVNADGRRDVVVGGAWLENPGGNVSTSAWPRHTFANDWNAYAAVQVVDVNGDGRADIVLSVSEDVGKLSWFKAPVDPRTGPWVEQVIGTGLDHVHGFAVVDVDQDGKLDVAASEYAGAGRLIAYLHRPRTARAWRGMQVGADALHNMRAGDVDHDGDVDFFGAYAWGSSPVVLYRNLHGTTLADEGAVHEAGDSPLAP